MRIFLLILLFPLIVSSKVMALQLSSDAQISIITCNPGQEVYTMYGHTAIRIVDPTYGIDVVYNYGIFSFETPNFLYRFAKGQTDYLMMGQEFSSFMPEYVKEKRSVYEQVLNLSVEGKNQLFQALVENAKKENRIYRYNFFTDNCATRVRNMIEKNAGVQVRFSDNHPTKSFRDLIKEFHGPFRWFDLGIDLLVGKRADETVSAYGQMFLPEYLMNQFATAEIVVDGKFQPLVKETYTILDFPNYKQQSDLPWPTIVFGLIFLAVTGISVRSFRRRSETDWLDYWLFALSGVAGLIIGWFTLFSEHPAVSPNYNLLWAFPLNLFFAGLWSVKRWRIKTRYYFWISGGALLLSFVMGQHLNLAVYFIILTLLTRVVFHLLKK